MVSSISAEIGWRPVKAMRPAQTGQGIISEGRLDAGAAALWRISSTPPHISVDDHFVNYVPVSRQSQDKLCNAHSRIAPQCAISGDKVSHAIANRGDLHRQPSLSRRLHFASSPPPTLMAVAEMQEMSSAARLARVANTEPSISMPRQASSTTKTAKCSRRASSAE